ncbi:MAG: WXG100 family type VII secretion target [Eubacteriales bacterium]
MATIEVNHEELRELAEKITDFCTDMDKEMATANGAVEQLLSGDWIGADAQQFDSTWQDIDSSSSTYGEFKSSMEAYSQAITSCATVYQTAQEDAYNTANSLPKILTW